ncbi:MAG TPA: hypothetical protein DDY12_01620 [Porphyromonadaceae bacterium]|nr:hypothetical protein [Porphyromonadaceae bacterium]
MLLRVRFKPYPCIQKTQSVAAINIQPHVRKKITPRQLLPLPWDKDVNPRNNAPQLTAEERQKRFEEMVKTV